MRIRTISKTGTGTTSVFPVNWRGGAGGFQIGLGVTVSGSATYTIEHCFDNILAGATPTFYSHSTLVAQTANKDGNYAFPITGIRINVTAGTGTVNLTIVPAETSA
jgi:archaellum component FlaF (FlaF/FlaG flagellin family)